MLGVSEDYGKLFILARREPATLQIDPEAAAALTPPQLLRVRRSSRANVGTAYNGFGAAAAALAGMWTLAGAEDTLQSYWPAAL